MQINLPKQAQFQRLQPNDGNSFLIERYTSPFFESPWHFHEEFELVHCEKGFGTKFIGSFFEPYEQGELLLIGSNLPHWIKADPSFYIEKKESRPSSLVLQFREDFLGNGFFLAKEMRAVREILVLSKFGLSIEEPTKSSIVLRMNKMLDINAGRRLVLLVEIFQLLAESISLRTIVQTFNENYSQNDLGTMSKIMDFTFSNFSNSISLEEVAQVSNRSVSSFCKYFKSRTRLTYISYLNSLRLEEAARLLKNSTKNVSEICFEVGFRNLSNFNRQFKERFGISPQEYKKMPPKTG